MKSLFNIGRDSWGGVLESRLVARKETEGRDLTDEETAEECRYLLEIIDDAGNDSAGMIKRACRYVLKKYDERRA